MTILLKQMGTNFLAHSILLVNVVRFNTRYTFIYILATDPTLQKGENSSISSHTANSTSLKTFAELAQINLRFIISCDKMLLFEGDLGRYYAKYTWFVETHRYALAGVIHFQSLISV